MIKILAFDKVRMNFGYFDYAMNYYGFGEI